MQAVILAAGIGKRMTNLDDEKGPLPKCLLKVGEETLLRRHLRLLDKAGVKKVHFILGYRYEDVWQHANNVKKELNLNGVELAYTKNDRFEEGSLLSMLTAKEVMSKEASMLMDADVLYPPGLLEKLIQSKNQNCFLLDTRSGASDEEMRLGADNGVVKTIVRGLPGGYEVIGEGVGFLKLQPKDSDILMDFAAKIAATGPISDYEIAINDFLQAGNVVGFELVDVPWLEIDFEEDVQRARTSILPEILNFVQASK